MISPKKLQQKLMSYIKFKDLAKSIKLVALSQLNNLKGKISSRGIALSSVLPFFNTEYYSKNFEHCMVMPIGVDKSCCGPHNANILRFTENLLDTLQDNSKRINVFTVGNRIKDFFKKYYSHFLYKNVYNIDKEPLSLTGAFILVEKMLERAIDRFYIIFNRYYTPFQQQTSQYELTGVTDFCSIALNAQHQRPVTAAEDYYAFVFRSDREDLDTLLNDLYFHSFSMFVLDSLEENEYSALGARVTAMDNSTQNATKMIDVLRLLYNKARQAAITNELIEIVSAANFV